MAKTPSIYSRLTRPIIGFATRYSLWLAPDHFMQVAASGYNERYQRFRFDEVQAFLVTSSARRVYWMLIWLLPWIFSGGSLAMNGGIVAAIFFTVYSALRLTNWLLGPSCKVYVVTRVQICRLEAVVRRRKIERVLERLGPMIRAAQAPAASPVPPTAPASGEQPTPVPDLPPAP